MMSVVELARPQTHSRTHAHTHTHTNHCPYSAVPDSVRKNLAVIASPRRGRGNLVHAAILFSDILTIPDAMGLGLYFAEGEGPKFERPLRSAADIDKVGVPVKILDYWRIV